MSEQPINPPNNNSDEENPVNASTPVWRRPGFWPRFAISSATLIFIGANSLTNFAVVNDDPVCIVDKLFDISANINTYLKDNVVPRNILMIVVALILDISIFMLSYCWIMYGKNWRPLLTLAMFYLLRVICQNLFLMKYPDNIIWEYPGFPSFAVSYHKTSDFFFAGQIGIFLISAMELWSFDFKVFSIIAYIGVILHFFMMVVLRGHYFIDLISGLMAAHYFHMMSDYMHPIFNKIFNLDVCDEEKKESEINQNLVNDGVKIENPIEEKK